MDQNVSYEFGLVGLGVMGRNFILNVAEKGFSALGYDLDPEKVQALREEGDDFGNIDATTDLKTFVKGLSQPRRIMMLVPAGKIVDDVIAGLRPALEEGDILVDGGNSHFSDTDRRAAELSKSGIRYFGAGVSGGAEGARRGPSIMPGGPESAYPELKPIFEAVAAQYQGAPCVAYLGPRSAGNYVKMVHNGIEYGLMQLTGEAYHVLASLGGLSNQDLSRVFDRWNRGRLQSYLVEISAAIFRTQDPMGPGQLIDAILDKAKQKGTGKWTSQNGMDLGIPVPTIDIAVTMRAISALKPMRMQADAAYEKPEPVSIPAGELENLCESALYFAFIMAYAQGLHQLSEASREYGYQLNIGQVARIWRAGCIIRAALLEDIAKAYSEEPAPEHLILSAHFIREIGPCLPAVRKLLNLSVRSGLPMPALSNSLAYFDAFTTGRLPLNLIQAQRDYFGAHTFERTDREGTFHADWE